MTDSFNKLWLKGQAEEDIYFARRDRELIEALRKKKLRKKLEDTDRKTRNRARKYEDRFVKISGKHGKKPKKMRKKLSKLLAKIRKRFTTK
ncbi:MAG: hypothetical protein KZQ87_09240 [Candidatus Thiodiazotropha sp. (ex Cardiolucina cf. quadrata)]|nr:hypothetical protein [Candidatus Thiodiazotropha sp. (ex Cardiolucina cf. quadrata)]